MDVWGQEWAFGLTICAFVVCLFLFTTLAKECGERDMRRRVNTKRQLNKDK